MTVALHLAEDDLYVLIAALEVYCRAAMLQEEHAKAARAADVGIALSQAVIAMETMRRAERAAQEKPPTPAEPLPDNVVPIKKGKPWVN